MSAADDKRVDDAVPSAVLQQAANGDAEALGAVYRHFHPRVLGLCRYLLGSSAEAEDAASEVFARLPGGLKNYDASRPFQRWLLSVTSHYCVDLLRRRQAGARIFEPGGEADAFQAAGPQPSPLDELLSAEARDAVREAIDALPERYRVPLVLRYYNDLGYDEIAAALQLTRANVATLIFRAKKELRVALTGTAEIGREETSP